MLQNDNDLPRKYYVHESRFVVSTKSWDDVQYKFDELKGAESKFYARLGELINSNLYVKATLALIDSDGIVHHIESKECRGTLPKPETEAVEAETTVE